jgi:hypothetical protein
MRSSPRPIFISIAVFHPRGHREDFCDEACQQETPLLARIVGVM